jgi:hypothetical protein
MNLDVAVLDIPCDWKPRKSATGGMLRPVGGVPSIPAISASGVAAASVFE